MKNFFEAIWCSIFHKEFLKEEATGDWVNCKCTKCEKSWFRFRI